MRQEILGVGFDGVTMDEAVERALELITRREGAYVCTPNPEIVMRSRKDTALREAINGASLVLPDGVGVVWAAKKLGKSISQRVTGYDFLLSLLEKMRGSVYILGGKPGVAEKAAREIEKRFPHVTVAGCQHGYFTDEDEVCQKIQSASPDFLMVCLGSPKQELWMAAHRDLGAGLMAGLGGSLDVLAGEVKRAPPGWQKRGLEWLYRLLHEPRRIKRQIRLPLFVAAIFMQGSGK